LSPHRLLFADADPSVLAALQSALARSDREIEEVTAAGEALRRLHTAHYDLIVAGESVDGVSLTREARTAQSHAKAIIVGDGARENVAAAMRAQAYGYFRKPVTAGPLNDIAQMALDAADWRSDVKLISATREWLGLEIRCKFEAAERATHFLRELERDLPPGVCEDVAAAFRELLLNAVEHGGRSNPEKRVRVSVVRAGGALIVHFQDPGKGFSMDLLPHAAISNPANSPTRHVEVRTEHGQRPGGFGILMTRSLGDGLVYSERGNEALFVKYLEKS
jgi:anti-sigma regulatory factor (Ser/Thr protein kinase)/CheY-like chemotaxis protein